MVPAASKRSIPSGKKNPSIRAKPGRWLQANEGNRREACLGWSVNTWNVWIGEVLIFLRLWSRRRAIWFRLLSFLYTSSPACLPDSTIEVDLVLDLLSGLRFSSSSGTCFSRLMTLFLLKEKFFPTDFPLAWTRSLSSLLLLLGPASPPYSMSQVWKNSYRFCFGIAKRKKSPTLEKGKESRRHNTTIPIFLSHPKKSESAKALLFVFGTSPWARTPSTKQLTTLLYIGLFQLLSLLSQPIDQDYLLVGRVSARIALPRIRERAR